MVIVRETYEIVTPESAELGDAEERGFIDEVGTDYTFRELVELLECTEFSGGDWFTAYDYDTDYRSGAVESRSYHPAGDRAFRYMLKAYEYANRRR